MHACFPGPPSNEHLYGHAAQLVESLFLRFGPTAPLGTRRWSDAEAFLEFLDRASLAVSNEHPARRVMFALDRQLAPRTLPQSWSSTARRLLAAECCEFLLDADVDAEQWVPYRRWVRHLEPQHTVVTFNYDMVAERAAKAEEVPLHVGLPGRVTPERVPVLLKLHGSVNWRCSGSPRKYELAHGEFAVQSPRDDEIVIASPGPTKFAVAGGALRCLWDEAATRLSNAEVIVFVGYRFPPSDSAARSRLLGAIAANAKPFLRIHTVLGPDTNHPDARRLAGLLEATARTRERAIPAAVRASHAVFSKILSHPLFAEDFLDTFQAVDLEKA